MNKNAFVDMEVGHVYGKPTITIPTEIGITSWNINTDSVCYLSQKFTPDIELERWKYIIDQDGKKKSISSVVNIKKNEYNKPLDKEFSLTIEQEENALQVCEMVHRDLNYFLAKNLKVNEVNKLVFFDNNQETRAFNKAKIDIDNYDLIDLQREIMNEYNIKQKISLEKVSDIMNFYATKPKIKTLNFEHEIPDTLWSQIELHNALGDSVRTFLAFKEFKRDRSIFKNLTLIYN
jgi:hypothetical protein